MSRVARHLRTHYIWPPHGPGDSLTQEAPDDTASTAGLPVRFPDGIDDTGAGAIFAIPPRYRDGDITEIWNEALSKASEAGGTVKLPYGNFTIPATSIGAAGSYKSVKILGEKFEGHYTDPDGYGTRLTLKGGANATAFEVAASNSSDVGPGPFQMENILLDCNASNQTGSNRHGVDFLSHTASSNKQRSGFFRRCYIRNVRTSGVRMGTLRNAGVMDQVCILTPSIGSALQIGSCNDWRFTNCDFGTSGAAVVQDSGGGSIFYVNCNFFVGGTHGYKGDTAALDHYFVNCSFDTNNQDGVNINTTSDYPWVFSNCRFQQNSYAANDTDAHINVGANNTLVSVTGCGFFPGSTNNPKYVLEIASGGHVTFVGNSVKAGSFVTSFDNGAGGTITRLDKGQARFGTYTAGAAADSTGFITIVDASGTTRKLMVQA